MFIAKWCIGRSLVEKVVLDVFCLGVWVAWVFGHTGGDGGGLLPFKLFVRCGHDGYDFVWDVLGPSSCHVEVMERVWIDFGIVAGLASGGSWRGARHIDVELDLGQTCRDVVSLP